jgi:integrase
MPPLRRGPSAWKGLILRPPATRPEPCNEEGLIFAKILAKSTAGYLRAFLAFELWATCFDDPSAEVPEMVARYVFWAYSTGEVSRQQVINLLSCLVKLDPGLASVGWIAGPLSRARSLLAGWKKLSPPQHRVPLPRGFLHLLVYISVLDGELDLATLLLVGHECLLRFSELLFLTVADVFFPGDPHLGSGSSGALLLHLTKAGRPQWVNVRSPLVLTALRVLVRGRRPGARLFQRHASAYRTAFTALQLRAGLPKAIWSFHSLRSGGAVHLYLINTLMMDIVTHGRWAKLVTAELYVKSCQCVQLALLYPDSLELRVKALEAAAVRDRLLVYFTLLL